MDVLDPLSGDRLHYEINDLIPVAQMMVERNRHAIMQINFIYGLFYRRKKFGLSRMRRMHRCCSLFSIPGVRNLPQGALAVAPSITQAFAFYY